MDIRLKNIPLDVRLSQLDAKTQDEILATFGLLPMKRLRYCKKIDGEYASYDVRDIAITRVGVSKVGEPYAYLKVFYKNSYAEILSSCFAEMQESLFLQR